MCTAFKLLSPMQGMARGARPRHQIIEVARVKAHYELLIGQSLSSGVVMHQS
jgi:hypothetical protein